MFKLPFIPTIAVFYGCVIAVIIITAYWPGMTGPMVFDDQVNIVNNPGVAIDDLSYESLQKALLSNESGRLKRVLPALSFGINHYFAGGFGDTFIFKITNLAIHVINSALVFWLVFMLWPLLLTRTELARQQSSSGKIVVPAFVALVWALHPIQLTSVVYVVQRMTSMAGMFVLIGLCLFLKGRLLFERKLVSGLVWMSVGVLAGTALGLLCKENALLLVLYAAVVEFTLFNRKQLPEKHKKSLYGFYTLILFIPAAVVLIYLTMHPGEIIGGYVGRPFTLTERLLTEARILWFYLYMLVVPDITVLGLYHDDIPISKDWLMPVTTLISVLAWVLLIVAAVLLRKKVPVLPFAVFWYLAGHSMESSIIPLQIIYEHRNYLPSLGVVILFCYCLFYVIQYLAELRESDNSETFLPPELFLGLCSLGVIAGLFYATFSRAEYWRTEQSLFTSIGINHPQSPISQYLYGEVLLKKLNRPFDAYPYYLKAAQLDPQETAFLINAVIATPAKAMAEIKNEPLKTLLNPQHIASQLQTTPISPWCITILDAKAKCVLSANARCVPHVDNVRSWLQAADENKRLSLFYKRQFIQQLFTIEMKYGKYQAALTTATQAQEKDPRLFHYYLMRAEALQALHRYQEAITILHKAEALARKYNPGLLANINRLRQGIYYAEQRQTQRQ